MLSMVLLCLYLFSFDICSGMCLSNKPINLLINKVYASFRHSLFTKSSHFVVNRELLKLSIFDFLKSSVWVHISGHLSFFDEGKIRVVI